MAIAAVTTPGSGLSDVQLGRLLQDRGYINEHQLADALRAQAAVGGRLGTILVKRGCMSDAQLFAALHTQDDLRRAGVVFELGVVAGSGTAGPGVLLAMSVTVPASGSQGGLPHHGIAGHQKILVPGGWLPCPIEARDGNGDGGFVLTAADGRMLDYRAELSIRPSDDPIPLVAGKPVTCPPGEPGGDGLDELTLRVSMAADSLRDGGAGRFSGRLSLNFSVAP